MDLRKWKTHLKNPYPLRITKYGTFFGRITPRELNDAKMTLAQDRNIKFSYAEEVKWWKRDMLQTKINTRSN